MHWESYKRRSCVLLSVATSIAATTAVDTQPAAAVAARHAQSQRRYLRSLKGSPPSPLKGCQTAATASPRLLKKGKTDSSRSKGSSKGSGKGSSKGSKVSKSNKEDTTITDLEEVVIEEINQNGSFSTTEYTSGIIDSVGTTLTPAPAPATSSPIFPVSNIITFPPIATTLSPDSAFVIGNTQTAMQIEEEEVINTIPVLDGNGPSSVLGSANLKSNVQYTAVPPSWTIPGLDNIP